MVFKYKAYYDLLLNLGRIDYTVEISEIAIRNLLSQIEASESPDELVKTLSNKYDIMLSYDISNNYYNQLTLSNIAMVYHLSEEFLYDMQSEYNSISESRWMFDKNKTKLDQVISYFNNKSRFSNRDFIPEYLIDTFAYYHQLRVYFSHKKTTSENEIEKKWLKAKGYFSNGELMKKYRINNAPNNIENLNFEDFFLFTQIAKDLCLKISSLCYPEAKGFAKLIELRKLKKHQDILVRKQRIESYLRTEYGYVKENDSDVLVDEISDLL
ncbi:hypothetical protein E0W68_13635 [Flavobacterium salilacus subsp. salilacus]|uniref:hypothetical protein n=1 Tax=Flavobacterium TaxID=237 RepID=UPI001074AD68|nr:MULTISPECIES: hypothetical protein [Flavobacterium]KAF2514510.1 hypothetical protein E0W68_13635 [Flavobacterium salilacus subsp. salilacus]MBE1615939.1 hypothetical protein [Flavobacterium sp. SaA2.13]